MEKTQKHPRQLRFGLEQSYLNTRKIMELYDEGQMLKKNYPETAVMGYPLLLFSLKTFFFLLSLFDFNFSDCLTCERPILTINLTIFSVFISGLISNSLSLYLTVFPLSVSRHGSHSGFRQPLP